MKFFRLVNLVKRDNRFCTETGMYLRIRRLGEDGIEQRQWVYLNRMARRIFELCSSGSFSCREISKVLEREGFHHNTSACLSNIVITTCQAFINLGLADWIDDEEARQRRLELFLRGGEEAVQFPLHLIIDPIPKGGEVQ